MKRTILIWLLILGLVLFTPSGVSMRPFIEGDKDSVVLTALERDPRIGDILLVGIPVNGATSYVLHRLVRLEHDQQGKITGRIHRLDLLHPLDLFLEHSRRHAEGAEPQHCELLHAV